MSNKKKDNECQEKHEKSGVSLEIVHLTEEEEGKNTWVAGLPFFLSFFSVSLHHLHFSKLAYPYVYRYTF